MDKATRELLDASAEALAQLRGLDLPTEPQREAARRLQRALDAAAPLTKWSDKERRWVEVEPEPVPFADDLRQIREAGNLLDANGDGSLARALWIISDCIERLDGRDR